MTEIEESGRVAFPLRRLMTAPPPPVPRLRRRFDGGGRRFSCDSPARKRGGKVRARSALTSRRPGMQGFKRRRTLGAAPVAASGLRCSDRGGDANTSSSRTGPNRTEDRGPATRRRSARRARRPGMTIRRSVCLSTCGTTSQCGTFNVMRRLWPMPVNTLSTKRMSVGVIDCLTYSWARKVLRVNRRRAIGCEARMTQTIRSVEHLLGAYRAGVVEPHADRDVDLISLEGLDGIRRREVQDVVGHPRRRRLSGHQRRQDQKGKDVGHPDREGSLGAFRVEAGIALEHALHLPQQLPEGLRKLDRPGRCLHARGRADTGARRRTSRAAGQGHCSWPAGSNPRARRPASRAVPTAAHPGRPTGSDRPIEATWPCSSHYSLDK